MDGSVVVDASVLTSWLVASDSNHKASRFWVEQYNATGGLLVAPALLVIEVAAAIARPTGQPELAKAAVKKLNEVRTLRLVAVGSVFARSAVTIASDLRLRAGDSTYVTIAHKLHIPLVSWDKEQLNRAAVLISTYSPENYPF